jgi:hypothetical protein
MSIINKINTYQVCDVLSYIPVVSTVTTLFHTVMAKSRQSDLFGGGVGASFSGPEPTTTYNDYIKRFVKGPVTWDRTRNGYNWTTICIEACPFGKLIQLLFSSCFAKKSTGSPVSSDTTHRPLTASHTAVHGVQPAYPQAGSWEEAPGYAARTATLGRGLLGYPSSPAALAPSSGGVQPIAWLSSVPGYTPPPPGGSVGARAGCSSLYGAASASRGGAHSSLVGEATAVPLSMPFVSEKPRQISIPPDSLLGKLEADESLKNSFGAYNTNGELLSDVIVIELWDFEMYDPMYSRNWNASFIVANFDALKGLISAYNAGSKKDADWEAFKSRVFGLKEAFEAAAAEAHVGLLAKAASGYEFPAGAMAVPSPSVGVHGLTHRRSGSEE